MTEEITHDELCRMLDYDHMSGRFFWRVNRRPGIKPSDEAGHRSIRPHHDRWVIGINGRRYLRSRLAWFWVTGNWPRLHIDHSDGDTLNDRWTNLREATHSQNLANAAKPKCGNSPLKGVSEKRGRYLAHIGFEGRQVHLGTFNSAEEAHAAYMKAAREFYGDFARAA